MKGVSIIMVNYNGIKYVGKKYLRESIEGFLDTDYPDFEFIFVDNASTDGSVEFVKNIFKKYINIEKRIVVNSTNLGFAGGCNRGIAVSRKELICLVNNDDRPLNRSWLKELVKVLESDSHIGVVFSKKLKWDNPLLIDAQGITINPAGFVAGSSRIYTKINSSNPFECLIWQTPVLFKKELIRILGGKFFDEDYVILHDDTDTSLRIWLAGYKVICVPTSVVLHKRSATMRNLPVDFVVFHGRKNIIQTLIKCYEFRNLIKYLPITLLVYLLAINYYILVKRLDQARGTLKAILWNILNLKRILIKRKNVQRMRNVSDHVIMRRMAPLNLATLLRGEKLWPR
ncbi:MAG: hypothetical protein DRO40_10115 [Thermoprotei archaeon]|nr:MAG: hypothetical protein DRO40_10115 [Thermoprotei archaeon]